MASARLLGHSHDVMLPVMAAEIADHGWTVWESLTFHVPPPRWTPLKRLGVPRVRCSAWLSGDVHDHG